MHKVLFVTHHYLKGSSGGCFATRAYVNACAQIADSVTLLVPDKDGLSPEGVDQRVRVIACRNDKPRLLKLTDCLVGKIHRFYGKVEATLAEGGYDTVVFDTSIVSYGQIEVAKRYGCMVYVIHHNYQYEYSRDNAVGFLEKYMLHHIARCEKEAVLNADVNLTLTEADKVLLYENYDPEHNTEIRVLGTFEYREKALLDVSGRKPLDINAPRFLITGSLDAYQTVSSLERWYENYLPILRAEYPNARIVVAGKNPSEALMETSRQLGVEMVPSPVSMDGYLLDADFYICPIDMGGGLKLRVMDGLKAGLPVLSHKVSVRGYDMYEDRYVFGYHDTKSFEEALARMVKAHPSAAEIQKAYTEIFSFSNGVKRFREII